MLISSIILWISPRYYNLYTLWVTIQWVKQFSFPNYNSKQVSLLFIFFMVDQNFFILEISTLTCHRRGKKEEGNCRYSIVNTNTYMHLFRQSKYFGSPGIVGMNWTCNDDYRYYHWWELIFEWTNILDAIKLDVRTKLPFPFILVFKIIFRFHSKLYFCLKALEVCIPILSSFSKLYIASVTVSTPNSI